MFKNRYRYTCPDVIHYRKNQYRAVAISTTLSVVPQLLFWAWITSPRKKNEPTDIETPAE